MNNPLMWRMTNAPTGNAPNGLQQNYPPQGSLRLQPTPVPPGNNTNLGVQNNGFTIQYNHSEYSNNVSGLQSDGNNSWAGSPQQQPQPLVNYLNNMATGGYAHPSNMVQPTTLNSDLFPNEHITSPQLDKKISWDSSDGNRMGSYGNSGYSNQPPPRNQASPPQQQQQYFADPNSVKIQDSTGLNFDFKDKIKDSTYQGTSMMHSHSSGLMMNNNNTSGFGATTTTSKLVDTKYTNVKQVTGLSAIPSVVEDGYSAHMNISVIILVMLEISKQSFIIHFKQRSN